MKTNIERELMDSTVKELAVEKHFMSRGTILDLIKAFESNPNNSTYYAFEAYLHANYATSKVVIDEYLEIGQYISTVNVPLSVEIKGVIEVALILINPSEYETGRKVVGRLCDLLQLYPGNQFFVKSLAKCFRKGATLGDLSDFFYDKKVLLSKTINWKSNQLGAYFCAKALELDSKDERIWGLLGSYCSEGLTISDFSVFMQYTLLFPLEARDWKTNQLIAYCYSKTVLINSNEGAAWYILGNAFLKGAKIAGLPGDFVLMIYSCIESDAPANYYCANFCFEKVLEVSQNEKMKQHVQESIKELKEILKTPFIISAPISSIQQQSSTFVNQPVNQSTQQPSNPFVNQSVNQSTQHPSNPSVYRPVNQSTQQPSNPFVNQSVNQSTQHPSNPSVYRPVSQSTQQPSNPFVNQSVNQFVQQPSNPSVYRPVNQSTQQPSNTFVNQSVNQSTQQPSNPSVYRPVN